MTSYTQDYRKVFMAPTDTFSFSGVKPQTLLNARFISNTINVTTPYFRNYIHSRRKLGLFLKYSLCAVFSNPNVQLSYREQFFTTWSLGLYRPKGVVRVYTSLAPARLSRFEALGLRRHYSLSSSLAESVSPAVGLLPNSRLHLFARARMRADYVLFGAIALKKFLLPIWVNALRVCTRTRKGLASRANLFFSALVPTFAFKPALGSGSVVRSRRNRFVYSEWIRKMPRHAKFYNRKRIMGRRYARLLFGVNRLRFFLSICDRLRKVTNRLARFRHLLYFKLITFIASVFRIGSPTRILMLIRAGHVFVNGQCVRNPRFQLSTLDVVSFSKIAGPWVERLRRLLSFRRRSGSVSRARRAWRPRVFRRAAQRSVVLGPNALFAVVRCVRFLPHPPALRGVERRPYMASDRIRFLLGTLQY